MIIPKRMEFQNNDIETRKAFGLKITKEETFQSIDNTLKRIEIILSNIKSGNCDVSNMEEENRGYETFTSILSDFATIQFSVPCLLLKKFEESTEWKAAADLLEKYQREYDQM